MRRFDGLAVSTNPHIENTRAVGVEVSGTANHFCATLSTSWYFILFTIHHSKYLNCYYYLCRLDMLEPHVLCRPFFNLTIIVDGSWYRCSLHHTNRAKSDAKLFMLTAILFHAYLITNCWLTIDQSLTIRWWTAEDLKYERSTTYDLSKLNRCFPRFDYELLTHQGLCHWWTMERAP